MKPQRAIALGMMHVALLGACAGTTDRGAGTARTEAAQPPQSNPFDRDRKAIFAMAGEFKVNFNFEETVVLKPGYQRHEPHRSDGHEFVEAIEDSGDRIVLQHVLVDPQGKVTKHWRQDWVYQPSWLWECAGGGTWKKHSVKSADAQGKWAQLVYQVDDTPRYAALGRWQHDGNESAWTSETTWRPLPRREYTTRSDYDVLASVNRHTITPDGWVHEQDNIKVVLKQGGSNESLVRERGTNYYSRATGYNFAPGRDYWRNTAAYWAEIRNKWAEYWRTHDQLKLRDKVDGQAPWEASFEGAKSFAGSQDIGDAKRTIAQMMQRFIQP
jgi:hypothetical protein